MSMVVIFFVQLLILGLIGFAGCWVAHRLQTPRIVGGIIAGMLLGPGVLGQAAPSIYRYVFAGGYEQYHELDQFIEQRREARQTLVATGVTDVAVEEFDRETEALVAQRRADLPAGPTMPQQITDLLTIPAMTLPLIAAGLAAPIRRLRPDVSSSLPVALGATLGGAVLAAFGGWLLIRLGRLDLDQPSLWLAGLAIGSAAVASPVSSSLMRRLGHDWYDVDHPTSVTESHVWFSTLIATALVLAAATAATAPAVYETAAERINISAAQWLWLNIAVSVTCPMLAILFAPAALREARYHRQVDPRKIIAAIGVVYSVLTCGFLIAVGGAWAAGGLAVLTSAMLIAGAIPPGPRRARRRTFWEGLLWLGEPLLFAIAGLTVNLEGGFDWLVLLIVVIAFGDGKAIGALVPSRMINEHTWHASLIAGGIMASGGATSIIVALLLKQAGVIGAGVYASLVIAAVISAMFAGPTLKLLTEPGAMSSRPR